MAGQKPVADRSRHRPVGLICRRRRGNANRAGDNVFPAIGRLDYDCVRVGADSGATIWKAITVGRPSGCKLAWLNLAVDHALDKR
jgi:hypothetical protein